MADNRSDEQCLNDWQSEPTLLDVEEDTNEALKLLRIFRTKANFSLGPFSSCPQKLCPAHHGCQPASPRSFKKDLFQRL